MIIASSSIRPIPITSTATATGSYSSQCRFCIYVIRSLFFEFNDYAISAYRVAGRAQRYAGGREPRARRTEPSGSARVTARRFDREQRPPGFEGVGSPELGRQDAIPIRARTEEPAFAEPAFARSPTVIDRHKIRSGGSEADAQSRTGGSSRRGGRLPESWR